MKMRLDFFFLKNKNLRIKNGLLFFIFFVLFSCGEIIDKPKTLLEQNKMAEAVAELALNDQLNTISADYKPNEQTLFILKKLKTDAKTFSESYKYYIAKGKMPKIYENAQEILKTKDPKAEDFINKKIEEQNILNKKELQQNPKEQD